MSDQNIFIVEKEVHRSTGVTLSVKSFSNREEAEKYAEYLFDEEKANFDSSGRILFGDWYRLYNEGNDDICEINIFKK